MQPFDLKKRVLVTGGAGFIGSHLVKRLVSMNKEVTIIDPLAVLEQSQLAPYLSSIHTIQGDMGVMIHEGFDLEGFDVIYHLAGNNHVQHSVDDPAYDFDANLGLTFKLLEKLRFTKNPPRLINTSSAAVYGDPIKMPIKEGDPTIPLSPYGVSKLAGESYGQVYSHLFNLPVISLRVFSVYGPFQKKLVIYDLMKKLTQGLEKLTVQGDGTQMRDFLFIDDLIDAFLTCAKIETAHGEVYNTASGKSITISELVNTICAICGMKPEIQYTHQTALGVPKKWEVDISNLTALGFSAHTSLNNGLAKTFEWMKSMPMEAAL